MMMNVKKHLRLLFRVLLPSLGFAFTCIGAYLVSQENQYDQNLQLIPAYLLLVLGFLAMLIGVFWTICNSMKSKVYQRGVHQQHVQVFTIERPSSFPPSYEESQLSQNVPESSTVLVDGVDVGLGLAPPLYCQDSSEVPDCRWSWEQPPCYSRVERELQPHV